MYAMWGAGYDPQTGFTSWAARVLPNQPSVNIQVRDPQHEGAPKWDWRTLIPEFSNSAYYRSNYVERECQPPSQLDLGVSPLWTYVAKTGGYQQPSDKLVPPIVVDWNKSKITHFSELVTARDQNCSYTFYSLTPLKTGVVNQADFEAPFAFYDLSGQGQGYPNLILRAEHYPANDLWAALDSAQPNRLNPKDLDVLRYSWRDTVGDWKWDYKVEMLGFQPYTNTVTLAGGALQVKAPAYAEFPKWATSQKWPDVTFVADEGNNNFSSEGIYDWSPRDIGVGYTFGWESQSDPSAFSDISRGYRGEYRFKQNAPTTLYFSPIDNRLHLLGAEGGWWRLNQNLVVQVANTDSGSYINNWTVANVPEQLDTNGNQIPPTTPVSAENTKAQLFALNNALLYADAGGVKIRQTNYNPASFTIAPPTDKATWQAFKDRLAPYLSQKRDPNNLASWLDAFAGKSLDIANAKISDIRNTNNGFRFTLTILPGFQVKGEPLLSLTDLKPGDYIVTYDGKFTIQSATPALPSSKISDITYQQLHTTSVQVTLRNDGLSDMATAYVELWATPPQGQGEPSPVATNTVTLLGKQVLTTSFAWDAELPGNWILTPKLRMLDGQLINLNSQPVSVIAAPTTQPGQVTGLINPPGLLIFIGLALVALASTIGVLAWWQWKLTQTTQVDDAT